MSELLDGIPVGEMNTSMTINAPAAWLFGLYVANAENQGVPSKELRGTTQNDIVKEYLSRGTYIFPPLPSRRLIVDMIAFCAEWVPLWNPMNVCSYHLQEAGATPVQELAYSLATAIGVLDAVKESGQVDDDRFPQVFASISFFVNSGIRFVEETAKMRAFTQLWDRIGLERYGVTDPKARRFRYGVQVNSLGLTEAQPENNVQRIVLEMLGVTLSRDARARSIQLPAWNEALGLPAAVGPAVGAAHAAGARLRDRPARVPRPLRGLDGDGGAHRPSWPTARGPSSRTCSRWAAPSRRSRSSRAGSSPATPSGCGSIESGDLTVVGVNRFTEALPVAARGRGLDPQGRPGRWRRRRSPSSEEWRAAARRGGGEALPRGAAPGGRHHARTSCRPPSTSPTPAAPPASGPACCARCSASTARPPAWRRRPVSGGGSEGLRSHRRAGEGAARRTAAAPRRQARASTATATAPSRSPSPPATPASR